MKKLIFLIMIAITMAAQGSNPVSSTRRVIQEKGEATYVTNYSDMSNVRIVNRERTAQVQKAPAEDEVTVPIEITGDSEFDYSMSAHAVPSDADDTSLTYSGRKELTLPPGMYDILIMGYSQNAKEAIVFVYEKVLIEEGTVIEGSLDDITLAVNVIPQGPDGTIIRADTEDEEGNIISGDLFIDILWKGHYFPSFGFGVSGLHEVWTTIRTNQISENFKFTRIDEYLWTGGVTAMILPIDFTKTEISPTLSNWQISEVDFCKTPLNINKTKVFDYQSFCVGFGFESKGKLDTLTAVFSNGDCTYTTLQLNENDISLWLPEDYNSDYDMWIYPAGSCFTQNLLGTAPAITGMPLKRGESGLCQLGINPSDFLAYNCTSDGFQLDGNPRYSGEIQYTTLGNCAPILTIMFHDATFDMTYTGRYGEDMQIDATGYPEWAYNWTEEQREELGLPVCDVAVDVDGERICDSIDNWWDVWAYTGVFDAEISTDNILIDETISGLSSAKIHYDSNIGNGTAPTLTYLQFRNNDDKVTDRLESPSDGYLEFYALAPIEKRWEKDGKWGTYFDTGEIASVKAEWSPMGQDLWKEIDLQEIPELFYLPGFGYCFRGYLDGVDKESDNKWYDLRVYVEDAYGAYQEQTISPAFRMESIVNDGIASTTAASNSMNVYKIDGTIVMRNATQTDINSLPSGLYIVRTGNQSRKIAIN